MRFLRKTHFWKDKRTFLDLSANPPYLKDGYPREGNVTIMLGEDNTAKGAFKMGIDEARAMRDVLSLIVKEHDEKMKQLHNAWNKEESSGSDNVTVNTPSEDEMSSLSFGQQSAPRREPERQEPSSNDGFLSFGGESEQSRSSDSDFSFDSPKPEKKNDLDIFGDKPSENKTKLQPFY